MNLFFSFWRNRTAISHGFVALALLGVATITHAGFQLPKAWVDTSSGYAIGGYDPVDYFVKGEAARPATGVEAYWGGVSWRFRNVGNKAAFLAHPRTYAPRFGGADPYLLAKRRTVLGNPTLFDIYEDRLYLFYSGITMSRWKQHRAAHIIHAKQAWPRAARTLGLDPAEPVNPSDKPDWER